MKQLGPHDEVIISDDGSADNTIAIIKALSEDRIKAFYNEGIHGFTHNFENALRNSTGDYIYLLIKTIFGWIIKWKLL